MNRRITTLVSVAALAAGSLAGCGDDKDSGKTGDSAGSTPVDAQAAAAATPQGKWAQELCTAMVGKAQEVQPPTVDPSSPGETKKGLVAFFAEVGGQVDDQVATIEKVGPPPGAAAADWEKAVEQLRATNEEVAKLRRGLRAAKAKTEADIDAVVKDLGEQMAELGQYQGPIAELSKSKALADAIAAEPACAKLS